MAGKFKFQDFLTPQEREALNLLREKLGGKTVYIPYPEEDHYHDFLQRRNQKIRTMYRRYKKLGLSNSVVYAEISIRLSCAKHLSMNRIRAILRGYKDTRGKE